MDLAVGTFVPSPRQQWFSSVAADPEAPEDVPLPEAWERRPPRSRERPGVPPAAPIVGVSLATLVRHGAAIALPDLRRGGRDVNM